MPIGNVGIHYSKSAELDKKEVLLSKRAKTHSSRLSSYASSEMITSKISERIWKVNKDHLHHWIFQGVDMQFIVNNESLWHCHPTGLCSSVNDVNYIVLAESSKSPEVIEHNHTIAMQFHIETHYQSTIKLIQNFVDGKIELIQNKGQIDINYWSLFNTGSKNTWNADAALFKNKQAADKFSVASKTNSVRKEVIRPTTARTGWTTLTYRQQTTRSSSRGNLMRAYTASQKSRLQSRQVRLFSVENNDKSATYQALKDDARLQQSNEKKTQRVHLDTEVLQTEEGKRMSKENKEIIKKFDDFLQFNTQRNNLDTGKLMKSMRKYIKTELTGRKNDSKSKTKLSAYDMNVFFKLNLIKELGDSRGKTKREIRKMLHPTLKEEQLPNENDSLINKHLWMNSLFLNKNKLKIEPKFFTRFNEFNRFPPSNFDVPIIRNSSPYVNEEQVKRQEFIESKKKWVDDRQFKSYFSKATKSDNFIPNYVTMTPSEPPILHKFRVVKREEWLNEDFKF